MLDNKLVLLGVDVKDSSECIQMMGAILYNEGYVQKEYAQAVIDREKIYPTGLQGETLAIAIPHTEPIYVKKPAIGVIVPKKPVKFLAMGTEDKWLECEIIFPLVVKDPHMQVKLLQKMIKVIQDGKLLNKIKSAKTSDEVIELLEKVNR